MLILRTLITTMLGIVYCKREQTIVFSYKNYLTQRHGVTEKIDLRASVPPCEKIQFVTVWSIEYNMIHELMEQVDWTCTLLEELKECVQSPDELQKYDKILNDNKKNHGESKTDFIIFENRFCLIFAPNFSQ